MQRVAVVGVSGSGKTTLARELAARIGAAHIELDSLFWLADWEQRPVPDFRALVEQCIAGDRWVTDGNYNSKLSDLVWQRADTIVWLDLPRSTVMRQLAWRTLSRMLLRRELWNGNREQLRNLFSRDPEKSILLSAWTRHGPVRERYARAIADPKWSHLEFVRLTSRAAANRFLTSVGPS